MRPAGLSWKTPEFVSKLFNVIGSQEKGPRGCASLVWLRSGDAGDAAGLQHPGKQQIQHAGDDHRRRQRQHPGERMLRIVDHCRPEPLAAMVPATPEESTWVVDTGRP